MSIGPTIDAAELDKLVADANANVRGMGRNRVVGAAAGARPRFQLYHSAPSLCSHKCRFVLAEKNVPYVSHDMSIMPMGKAIPQNYRPAYVRLRLKGAGGEGLASGYTGESSVTNQGLDPCVVPTLVDHQARRVVTDSRAICEYIDREAGEGARLVPDHVAEQVLAQVALVDEAPHVAFLYGGHPDKDDRPPLLQKNIAGVHARKIRTLKAVMELVTGDGELEAAYRAKISKESAAGHFVIDADGMRETHERMVAHVDALESQLESHGAAWACGDAFTLADVMWTVSLYRVKWMGLGGLWGGAEAGRPRVAAYAARALARPAFRSAVVDWPGAYAPSPHAEEFAGGAAKQRFALGMLM
ncbi:MAG: glutathione S-transferase family protein, partial [Caulobacterales bacterium]|nr:glutathione S-transferase family protein [Caulobacterales bacterium]